MKDTFSLRGSVLTTVTVLIAVLALTFVGCETDSPAYDEEPVRQTADSPVSESDEVIEITMREFEFEPAVISIPVGKQVTLKFENVGSLTHEFMAGAELVTEGEGFETGLFSGVDVHFRKNGERIKHEMKDDEQAADSTIVRPDSMKREMAAADTAHMEGRMEGEHHGKMLHLEPGDVGSLTFTLPESKIGEYTFGCFEMTGDTMHLNRGMQGTITVEDESQAG